VAAVVLPLLLAARAWPAANINLEADTAIATAGIQLTLAATNAGTAVARDLVPEVTWLGRSRQGEKLAALPPGGRRPWDFSLPPPPASGTFPLVLRLRYTDGDGRAASALLVRTAGTAAPGPVRAVLTAAPIATVGTVRLRLENPGARPVAGRVVTFLPSELATDPESQPAQVPGGGSVELALMLQNVRAAAGASYPVYAVFEYDWGGAHHTVLAGATLPIVAAPNGRARRLAVGTTALLAALAIAVLLGRRAARRARPSPAAGP
jgi:hypothetical protein